MLPCDGGGGGGSGDGALGLGGLNGVAERPASLVWLARSGSLADAAGSNPMNLPEWECRRCS